MKPKEIAEFDQNTKLIIDTFPTIWAELYHKLIELDVPKDHARDMLVAFISKT